MHAFASALTSVALVANAMAIPFAAVFVVGLWIGNLPSWRMAAGVGSGVNLIGLSWLRPDASQRTLRLTIALVNFVLLAGLCATEETFPWALPAFFPGGPLLAAIVACAFGRPSAHRRPVIAVSAISLVAAWTALLVPRPLCDGGCSKRMKAAADTMEIESALHQFQQATGRYPTTAEGLQPLISDCDSRPEGCELSKSPLDPWGNPYLYSNEKGEITISSFGADGQPGGDGAHADISNLDL